MIKKHWIGVCILLKGIPTTFITPVHSLKIYEGECLSAKCKFQVERSLLFLSLTDFPLPYLPTPVSYGWHITWQSLSSIILNQSPKHHLHSYYSLIAVAIDPQTSPNGSYIGNPQKEPYSVLIHGLIQYFNYMFEGQKYMFLL
jgi:hypothetical protein